MKSLYMAVDIGGVSIKGILLDEEGNIISKYSLRIDGDYVTTYGRVINKLRSSVDTNLYKVCTLKMTGRRKRLIERSLGREYFVNEITSISNYVLSKNSNVKTIIDIGNTLKIISINNSKVSDYFIDDINSYGKFIDRVVSILKIDNINDIKVYKSNVLFNDKNTILFDYNIINILTKKYSKEDILIGVYNLVIQNIRDNIKDIKVGNDIVVTGGLSLNKPFIKLLEKTINKRIIVLDNSEYVSVLGTLIKSSERELIHK